MTPTGPVTALIASCLIRGHHCTVEQEGFSRFMGHRLGTASFSTQEPGPRAPGALAGRLLHTVAMPGRLLALFLESSGLITCREQPGLPVLRTCETKY